MRFLSQILIPFVLISELLGAGQNDKSLIHVTQFGTIPLLGDDDSLVFYATVENPDIESHTIGLKMEKCCQLLNGNEIDCESMVLHSGLDIIILPKEHLNLTMFYTNMYLHGRSGNCSILLRWRPANPGQKGPKGEHGFTVLFDTVLPERNIFLFWQRDPDKYSICSSLDEDPKNDCRPVNCLIKYSGFRNFYDFKSKRCEKASPCINPKADTGKLDGNALKILSPISSKCLDLSIRSFPGGLKLSGFEYESRAKSYPSYPIKNKCIYGFTNNTKCTCYKGWTSTMFPSETFDPTFDTYPVCDVQSWDAAQAEKARNASISLAIIFVLIAILLACICLCVLFYLRKKCMSGEHSRLSSKNSTSSSGSKIISEVRNRREVKMRPAKSYPTQKVLSPEQNEMMLKEAGKRNSGFDIRDSILSRRASQTKPEESSNRSIELTEITSQESGLSTLSASSTRKDKYMPSRRSIPLTVFHPQFSKTAMIPLPVPLTPVKVNSLITGTPAPGPSDSSMKAKTPVPEPPENQFQSKKDSPSVVKLKSILKQVDNSTKELSHEITVVTSEVSDRSLDKFSAMQLSNDPPAEENSKSLVEFWENISESGSESSSESTTPEEIKKGYWVNKLHAAEFVENPPNINNSSTVAKSSVSQPNLKTTTTGRWITSKDWESKVEALRSHFQITTDNTFNNNQNEEDSQNHTCGSKASVSISVPNVTSAK